MLRNRKGMTLLEIMIVLAILATLIGILASKVTGRLKAANVKQAKIQIAEISKALDLYYTDCNSQYPSSSEGLNALVTQSSSCTQWGPDPYLKKLPKDPWGTPYIYESNGGSYTIISLGADKKEGGTNENADINSQDI